jgi:lambda repressor-like predicted transcriptional regulator
MPKKVYLDLVNREWHDKISDNINAVMNQKRTPSKDKMTQAYLSELTDIDKTLLSRRINKERKWQLDEVCLIAEALGVPPEAILPLPSKYKNDRIKIQE